LKTNHLATLAAKWDKRAAFASRDAFLSSEAVKRFFLKRWRENFCSNGQKDLCKLCSIKES
jgi:hypothetical protein